MTKVLIIEPTQRVIDILTDTLVTQFGIDVESRNNVGKDLSFIDHSINLIVVRNKIDDEHSANSVLNYVYDNSLATKVIVLGSVDFTGCEYVSLPDRFRIEQFKREVISLLRISALEIDDATLPDYLPIPFYHLYLMTESPCDVYIRIEREGMSDKFVKRIHIKDTFNKDSIKKYEENDIKALYIPKDQRHLFMEELIRQSINSLKVTKDVGESLKVLGDLYNITTDIVLMGTTDANTSSLVVETVSALDSVIQGAPHFFSVFKELMSLHGSLSYRKAFMIMLFSNEVLKRIDWLPETKLKEAHETLMYMAFFSDIFLSEDKLLRIRSTEDLNKANLSDEERNRVKNHASLAATLVQSLPNSPTGIDVIIGQHHGTTKSSGFPERYSSAVSKMAIIYAVLEGFAWKLINFSKDKDSLESVFLELEDEFEMPTYKSVVIAIEKSFSTSKTRK